MSSIASQFAAGVAQAQQLVGTPATYQFASDGSKLSLQVSLISPMGVADDGGVIILSEQWQMLIVAADLVFNDAPYEPQSGDTITVGSDVYSPGMIDKERNYWAWADRFQVRRKLSVKKVKSI